MDANVSVVDFDPNFEPQIRARSNTWPCRPVEDFVEGQQVSPASDDPGINDHSKDVLGIKQKTSSRRNAWGNLSYADLITKAIQGSPEQRLTLSQIYDWMVQNVPYFKDKGDNTSSAGWKNSIRHNLSLHSRFMRIQNEGTGKSSWWVINPDAKPGKAPRRRAGSMETKKLESKRGRLKKRVEAIRAAQENGGSLSGDDFTTDFNYNLSLSPEFRNRAGSNASSCGRLSPIQAAVEPDLHEGQVPPMSPIPWGTEAEDFTTNSNESYSLVDSLVGGLNIKEENDIEMNTQQLLPGGMPQFNMQNKFDDGEYKNLPAPPSYNDHLQQQNSQQPSVLNLDTMAVQNGNYSNMTAQMYQDTILANQQQRQMLASQNIPGIPVSNPLGISTQQLNSPARSPQLSPSNFSSPHVYNGLVQSPQPVKQQQMLNRQQMSSQQQQQQQQQQLSGTRSLLQQCLEAPNDSMLRAALTQQQVTPTYPPQSSHPLQQQSFDQFNIYPSAPIPNLSGGNSLNNINNNINMLSQTSVANCAPTPQNISQVSHMTLPTRNISNPSLAEIDTESMLDLDYDVEQLLRQELAIDANLDFNFDSNQPTQNISTSDKQNLVR